MATRLSFVSLSLAGAACAAAVLAGQTSAPKTHRLEATPATVAVGYYWSEAKPALRIASGDIIDVDTLLTNNPAGLARAGVPDDKIQASLKAITTEVTGDRRGPRPVSGPELVQPASSVQRGNPPAPTSASNASRPHSAAPASSGCFSSSTSNSSWSSTSNSPLGCVHTSRARST
jgi:hypothetical protein